MSGSARARVEAAHATRTCALPFTCPFNDEETLYRLLSSAALTHSRTNPTRWCVACTQLFLLNMMIGIVGSANMQVHNNADRVARFERGLLIIDKEMRLLQKLRRADTPHSRAAHGVSLGNKVLYTLEGLLPRGLQTHTIAKEQVRPNWLHVLLPPASQSARGSTSNEQSDIAALRKKLGRE